MVNKSYYYVGVGLLAFVLGPLFVVILGKAGLVYGPAIAGLILAGRIGARERFAFRSALAGMLTITAPALAAGLPARWVAEALFYNHFLTPWEQVEVSAFTFAVFIIVGAVAGMIGGAFRKLPSVGSKI